MRGSEVRRDIYPLLLLALVAGLLLLAWLNRWILDDAFISLRYADFLARGEGLVWNPGEPLEGFTNLLWTLTLAAAMTVGLDPIASAWTLSLASFGGVLLLSHGLVRELGGSRAAALTGVLLLGLNYTQLSFATSGLETQTQALLFIWGCTLVIRSMNEACWPFPRLIGLSVLAGVALWLRLDSALLVALNGGAALYFMLRQGQGRTSRVMALTLPFILLVGGLLLFKWLTFGSLLPNSYYARAAADPMRGLGFVMSFLINYWLVPILGLCIVALPRLARMPGKGLSVLFIGCALWIAYLIYFGGDFMEYRLLVPILPLGYVAVICLLREYLAPRGVRIALAVVALSGSGDHFRQTRQFFLLNGAPEVENITILKRHIENPVESWVEVGQALGRQLNHDPTVVIATSAAGAIPYYSRLKTIDLYGVNDPWVARRGRLISTRPGHQRVASLDYLLRREVNLLVQPFGKGDPLEHIPFFNQDWLQRFLPGLKTSALPKDASVMELPISEHRRLRVLYLRKNPVVEAAIAQYGWTTVPLVR